MTHKNSPTWLTNESLKMSFPRHVPNESYHSILTRCYIYYHSVFNTFRIFFSALLYSSGNLFFFLVRLHSVSLTRYDWFLHIRFELKIDWETFCEGVSERESLVVRYWRKLTYCHKLINSLFEWLENRGCAFVGANWKS